MTSVASAAAPGRCVCWVLLLTLVLTAGCGPRRLLKENPEHQRYTDATASYFAEPVTGIVRARFGWVNRDSHPDLVFLKQDAQSVPYLEVWANSGSGRFVRVERLGWQGEPGDRILDLVLEDLDHDRVSDVVLVGRFADGTSARLLFNNGKGYFYRRHQVSLPLLPGDLDRVAVVDLDQDGHSDLFFTGNRAPGPDDGYQAPQAHILLNDGQGRFQDVTHLLMPDLPPGIVGAAFADYNGDAVVDVFLVYSRGRNRLLLNNGHGQFTDRTDDLLPPVMAESAAADWADFDGDGDNDLLVVNRSMRAEDQAYPGEYCYMLVNNGNGFFRKGPLKVLPQSPSHAVYLLDANGSGIPDVLILSERGIHFLRGRGHWQFWKESRLRLPRNVHFRELVFSDVDHNGHLDLFGVDRADRKGWLWLSEFP